MINIVILLGLLLTIQIAKTTDVEEKTEESTKKSMITQDDMIDEWPPGFNEFTDRNLAPNLDDEIEESKNSKKKETKEDSTKGCCVFM